MNPLPIFLGLGGLLVTGTMTLPAATGLDWIDHNTNLNFYGDIRLRYEADWDSQTAAGVPRDDRHRGRLRARFGFNYNLAESWTAGARVRTGNSRSQQSPHLTFVGDDDVRDDLDFVVDRYFAQYAQDNISAWAGRNTSPFWQQNELFWDEDVTPTGLAGSYRRPLGKTDFTATAGAFYLPDGGYDLHGRMIAGQVKLSLPIDASRLTFAAGAHYLDGEDDPVNLLNRNGERDYLIGVANAQYAFAWREIPISLGADLFHNFQDYNAADVAPLPADTTDETLGYVLSIQAGTLSDQHDWLLGYYYAHIETFAVNASYAQDDWVRFGSGAQTDSSDFKGHEFRVGYALSKNLNLLARLYLVEAITTVQDGNRFRLDLNWRF
ncbi:MAG TPA: putative porin [Methylomirabilota bacterium]|nr:putative porin [Methylomirabilota bacterium]